VRCWSCREDWHVKAVARLPLQVWRVRCSGWLEAMAATYARGGVASF
jgi:hypothetical protein